MQRLRDDDKTPAELAQRLDPATVQTPALALVDAELVAIRDHVAVMFERRQRMLELIGQGVELQLAIERAEAEVADRGNDRLIVSMAPQEGKSQRITRYGLLWLLRQFPTLRIGIVSYDVNVSTQWSWQIRGDIELFDGESNAIDLGLRLISGQKAMSRWSLLDGGGVFATSIGGGLTSRPLDMLVIDDPVKDFQAADSVQQSFNAWLWWVTVARPRLAPWAPVIEVATAWHELDLRGRLLIKQEEDQAAGEEHFDTWRHLNVPAQADHDPERGEVDPLGREPGEFMVSARGRTLAQWMQTKAATAARFWLALYQGRPAPEAGNVWLRQWWRRYEVPLWSLAEDGTYRVDGYELTQSWDCAFRSTQASDFVVGQVWAKRGADSYLVYELCRRMTFTETVDAVRHVTHLFPQCRRKLVEAKANGDAVIDSLKHEIPGIIAWEPGNDSKSGRATAVSPFIRAGNVHLPSSQLAMLQPELMFDVEALITEAAAFPNGAHDDQVDACSQYLMEAYLIGGETLVSFPVGQIARGLTPGRRGATQLSPIRRRLTERQMRLPGGR